MKSGRTIAVMPAYNAERTVEKTFYDIPTGSVEQVILVGDASTDNTVDVAKRLGITVLHHTKNFCGNNALVQVLTSSTVLYPDVSHLTMLYAPK